jgi:hypothetical protein
MPTAMKKLRTERHFGPTALVLAPARRPVYLSELRKLEQSGPLTPPRVVDVARDVNNPLHECFDWDDTKAAEKYRLLQARWFIAAVLVDVYDVTKKEERLVVKNARALLNVVRGGKRQYISSIRIAKTTNLAEQAIDDVLMRIQFFQVRYAQFSALVRTLNAFEKRLLKLKRK